MSINPKLLLISPDAHTSGVWKLHADLNQLGIISTVLDLPRHDKDDEKLLASRVIGCIQDHDFDNIAFSLCSDIATNRAKDFIPMLRKIKPTQNLICGGPCAFSVDLPVAHSVDDFCDLLLN